MEIRKLSENTISLKQRAAAGSQDEQRFTMMDVRISKGEKTQITHLHTWRNERTN